MDEDKYQRIGQSILFQLRNNIQKEPQPLNDNIHQLFNILSMDKKLKYILTDNQINLLSDNPILSVIVNGIDKDEYNFNGIPFYLSDIEINPLSIKLRKGTGIFLILSNDDKNILIKYRPQNISILTELKNVMPCNLYNKTYTISKIIDDIENNYLINVNQNDMNKIFKSVLKNYDTDDIYFQGQPLNYIIKTESAVSVKKINPVVFLFRKNTNEFIMVLDSKKLNKNLPDNLIEKLDTSIKGEHSISFDLNYPPKPKNNLLLILLISLCVVMLVIIVLMLFYK